MQNQAEYRENAMRDRHQTGDWYSHDTQRTTVAAGHKPSTTVKKLSQESEAWFEYGNGTPSTARNGSSEHHKQAVGPGRLNGSQNWYQHDEGPGGSGSSPRRDLHPVGVSQSKVKTKPCTEERKAREAAAGDPNDWFRHDHKETVHVAVNAAAGRESTPVRSHHPSKKPSPSVAREADDRALWFAGVDPSANGPTKTPPHSGSRHSNPQADAYYQRDKTGSGADWFPHIHNDQSSASASSPTGGLTPSKQQQRPTSGSNKMNIESHEWFSHEDPPAPLSPRSAASPEVRKMRDRASGDEVRQILRIEENLEHRRQQPEFAGDSGSAELYTGSLVEKFQQQVALTTPGTE